MAVPDLTEYVAATSAGGSSAGLSRPSLVRHRASLFISTRMPPENLLRIFYFCGQKQMDHLGEISLLHERSILGTMPKWRVWGHSAG